MNNIIEAIANSMVTEITGQYANGYMKGDFDELRDSLSEFVYDEVITLGADEAFDAVMDADLQNIKPDMLYKFSGITEGSLLHLALSLVYENAFNEADSLLYSWGEKEGLV
jgi:predicted HAD superfamily Cof-like phosphohydrolase